MARASKASGRYTTRFVLSAIITGHSSRDGGADRAENCDAAPRRTGETSSRRSGTENENHRRTWVNNKTETRRSSRLRELADAMSIERIGTADVYK